MAGGHGLYAGITYNPVNGVLRAVDYTAGWPCTPARLYAMDQACGWGKVVYDAAADTYTINADLWIGDNDQTDTYFQLGSREHPRERLVVKGNVVVYPFHIAGQNPESSSRAAPHHVNRLTVGVSNEAAITATLAIASEPGAEHSLFVARIPRVGEKYIDGAGGQLHVYNGTITAAIEEDTHAIGAPGDHRIVALLGESIILHRATLSWMAGFMTYGNVHGSRDTLFENGGTALIPGKAEHVGAVFRNLKTAVLDNGSADVTLIDCVFTNNDRNWSLRYSDAGLTCIDCAWAPPKKGDLYRAWQDPKTKKIHTPIFMSRRHIVVAVTDNSGRVLTNAFVEVSAEQSGEDLIDNANVATDAFGKTPGWHQGQAILLTEEIRRATDVPNQPSVSTYSYGIRVTAPGYQPATVKAVKPNISWQVIPVVLWKSESSDRRNVIAGE